MIPLISQSSVKKVSIKNYSGVLIKKSSNYLLQTFDSKGGNAEKFTLTFQDAVTETVVSRLKSNDFISVQGTSSQNANENTLQITSLHFVGLNLLLGTWAGDDEVCYDFQNFTTLLIYNKNSNGICKIPTNISDPKWARKMSYFVNPDAAGWYLLISDKSSQYIAELITKNSKTIQFNLFDKQTGVILSKVILRR